MRASFWAKSEVPYPCISLALDLGGELQMQYQIFDSICTSYKYLGFTLQ